MKQCNKCKENKSKNSFGVHKSTKDKLQSFCKTCIIDIRKQWKINNPNGDKNIYLKKQSHYKKKSSDRYYNNREELLEQQKDYYKNNKEKILNYYSEWVLKNRDVIRKYNNERNKNPLVKISRIIHSGIWRSLNKKGYIRDSKIENILGCTFDEFKKHIESQFTDGMTWDNHGRGKNNSTWHIDHTLPISSATTLEEVNKLNHYTNLKPMWGSDNIRKSNKL